MGLTNNDIYIASNGAQQAGTYISFANENIYLRQSTSNISSVQVVTGYTVSANYRVYWNQACRDNGLPFLDIKPISTTINVANLNSNLYTTLYNVLQVQYPNTVNS